MPRSARKKEDAAIYHVMSRSITEFDLFPDDSDRDYFLDLLQGLKIKCIFMVYGYCLMTNHYHLIIDSCGYDISKLMKSLNQKYVRYINKKYNRRGHLMAERFNSKIIDSDQYMLTASAYVHNNPKDLPYYAGREYEYPYSSMGIYTGMHRDKRELINTEFVLGCVNEKDKRRAIKAYIDMVAQKRDIGIDRKLIEYLDEFKKEQFEYKPYRNIIIRDKKPEEVIRLIAVKLGIDYEDVLMQRWKRKTMEFRRIVAYALTTFCGMGVNDACKYMYNITASCCAKLSNEGFESIKENLEIKNILISA